MRTLACLVACVLAFAGCGVLDIADLEGGSVRGTVVDKIPVVAGGRSLAGGSSAGTAYYIVVEDETGAQSRYEVTHAAFIYVEVSDRLPDDLYESMPALSR